MLGEVTLQINLSAGDLNYAHLTVPALISQHQYLKKRLLVLDCLKPQKTKIVNPELKYPEPEFSLRIKKLKVLVEDFLAKGLVSDIYFLEEGDPFIKKTLNTYFKNFVTETHEYGGIGIISYLAGIELTKTKYVLHYDGDMLFYQKAGFNWVESAIEVLNEYTDCISITPGIAPPTTQLTRTASFEHWSENLKVTGGYKDKFFSARQFLIDKDRLYAEFPLFRGIVLLETLLVKYLNRGYPRSVENIFFKRFSTAGKFRFMMDSHNCWVLHPLDKPLTYLEILPFIIENVNSGVVPMEQEGHENINLEAWLEFFKIKSKNHAHKLD